MITEEHREIMNGAHQEVADAMQRVFIVDLLRAKMNDKELKGTPSEVLESLGVLETTRQIVHEAMADKYEQNQVYRVFTDALVETVYEDFVKYADWKSYIERSDEILIDVLGGVQGES
jgi:hypothetical protein